MRNKSTTFGTFSVPENVDEGKLRRDLAKDGFQVVQTNFHHDPITNKRTGKGFVQVRARNDRALNGAAEKIEAAGVKLGKNVTVVEENRTQRLRG